MKSGNTSAHSPFPHRLRGGQEAPLGKGAWVLEAYLADGTPCGPRRMSALGKRQSGGRRTSPGEPGRTGPDLRPEPPGNPSPRPALPATHPADGPLLPCSPGGVLIRFSFLLNHGETTALRN